MLLLLGHFLRSSVQTELFAAIEFTAISMTVNKYRCFPRLSQWHQRPSREIVKPEPPRAALRVQGENLLHSHTIIKKAEWFSLRHLRHSWSQIQQVSYSSAEGLVIRGLAGAGGGGGNDWWPWGECQNYKSNWAWPTAPIKFIYIFTSRPHLKLHCLDDLKRREAMILLLLVRVGGWIHIFFYFIDLPIPIQNSKANWKALLYFVCSLSNYIACVK